MKDYVTAPEEVDEVLPRVSVADALKSSKDSSLEQVISTIDNGFGTSSQSWLSVLGTAIPDTTSPYHPQSIALSQVPLEQPWQPDLPAPTPLAALTIPTQTPVPGHSFGLSTYLTEPAHGDNRTMPLPRATYHTCPHCSVPIVGRCRFE
jgi:hypothetical protein